MVAQNVKTEAASYFSSKASRDSSKASKNDFMNVMDQSLNTTKESNHYKKLASNEGNKVNSETQENTAPVDNKLIKEDEQSVESKKTMSTLEDSNAIQEDDLLKMQQLLAELGLKITDIVKQVLNLSDGELKSVMDELGMQMTDLLQPNNLKQLVLTVNGAEDISDLLTNEDMAFNLTKITQELDDIDLESEFGISKEELLSMVDAMSLTVGSQKIIELESFDTKPENNQVNAVGIADEPKVEITVETKNSGDTLKQQTSDSLSGSNQIPESEQSNETVLDSFVQNLAGVTAQNVDELSEQVSKLNQMKEIVTQVVDKIKVLIKPDSSSMELQLNPENLGKINLTVLAKNGQLTASFVTENQLAKEALENQLHTLKDNLNNQGLKVDAIEVTVSSFAFGQSSQADGGSKQQKGSTKRSINLDSFNYADEDSSEEEILAAKVLEQNGGSVDYTA